MKVINFMGVSFDWLRLRPSGENYLIKIVTER